MSETPSTLKSLIDLNIELEGLLRVLADRDSAETRRLVTEKFEEYSRLMTSLATVEKSADDDKADDNTIPANDTDDQITQMIEIEIEEEPVDEKAELAETPVSQLHAYTETAENGEPVMVDAGDVTNFDETTDELVDEDTDVEIVVEPAVEPPLGDNLEEHTLTPPDETPVEDKSPVEAETKKAAPKHEVPEQPTLFDDLQPDASKDDIRVDELLTRREARDLKRAFTLNDKFRFRRELFGNNDSMFADTLNAIMAMKSIDEATEYLYQDLGWDADNEDVKDFVTIVSKHFAEI